jgi:hypothetical protein
VEYYKTLALVMPLARAPMDKRSANSLKKYEQQLLKSFDSMTPWLSHASGRLSGLRGKVKPGEVVVLLDGSDIQDEDLYKGAQIKKE